MHCVILNDMLVGGGLHASAALNTPSLKPTAYILRTPKWISPALLPHFTLGVIHIGTAPIFYVAKCTVRVIYAQSDFLTRVITRGHTDACETHTRTVPTAPRARPVHSIPNGPERCNLDLLATRTTSQVPVVFDVACHVSLVVRGVVCGHWFARVER